MGWETLYQECIYFEGGAYRLMVWIGKWDVHQNCISEALRKRSTRRVSGETPCPSGRIRNHYKPCIFEANYCSRFRGNRLADWFNFYSPWIMRFCNVLRNYPARGEGVRTGTWRACTLTRCPGKLARFEPKWRKFYTDETQRNLQVDVFYPPRLQKWKVWSALDLQIYWRI